ncbi:MAG: ChbG/HpnK family deacetylase [Acidobacteria bacterium]|nr:ChbG/HpnK family deacetylase [Acidobacteriota bacterium]
MLRRVVINADDLGLTRGVNRGIFDAHDWGVLTSASLFAGAPATADAVAGIRHRPSLGVGCHLTLVDGQPTLPPDRLPTLVAGDGRFRRSWKPFIVACLAGRVSCGEVERELTAQIDKIRSEGIHVTHLDAHTHVHAFPPVFGIVARLAKRFDIPVVRVPYERWSWSGVHDASGRNAAWRQGAQNLALWHWSRRDRHIAAAHGLSTPHVVGRVSTGLLNGPTLEALLRGLPPGVTELMVHPGYLDDALTAINTRLRQSRADEVELLCAPETRDLVARAELTLVRHDLTPVTARILRYAS